MPWFQFEVRAHYLADYVFAKTEEEAKEIVNNELQYNGEEWDTDLELYNIENE